MCFFYHYVNHKGERQQNHTNIFIEEITGGQMMDRGVQRQSRSDLCLKSAGQP